MNIELSDRGCKSGSERVQEGKDLDPHRVRKMLHRILSGSYSTPKDAVKGGGRSRGDKITCGPMKWSFAFLVSNVMWCTLLLYQYSFNSSGASVSSLTSSMSLGQQSSWLKRSNTCAKLNVRDERWAGNLREFEGAWNRLCFGRVRHSLRIASFVKKWPVGGAPGGMERHAQTLYRDLASRGHEVHVFTVNENGENISQHTENKLHVHLFPAPPKTELYSEEVWQSFLDLNASSPFDIVHTESKALSPWKAAGMHHTAATWHGIAAEAIHSDIAMDRGRKPGEDRSEELKKNIFGRITAVVEETKIFSSYYNHVAISDYVADVLRTIYEIPVERVHTIFNGVHPSFRPNVARGALFRTKYGIPKTATLVFGAAGRLVKDKGHPLLFEAFSEIMQRHPNVYLLVAGSGPWEKRYAKLAPNVISLGPMPPEALTDFYNALDVFINPTLRSQGLDTTLLEALQCGKPLLATRFSSITWSVILNQEFGSTFAANVPAIVAALESMISKGRVNLEAGANLRYEYASMMFTAEKMGAAYERLFLCLKDEAFCAYPLPTDCQADDEEPTMMGHIESFPASLLGRVS